MALILCLLTQLCICHSATCSTLTSSNISGFASPVGVSVSTVTPCADCSRTIYLFFYYLCIYILLVYLLQPLETLVRRTATTVSEKQLIYLDLLL